MCVFPEACTTKPVSFHCLVFTHLNSKRDYIFVTFRLAK